MDHKHVMLDPLSVIIILGVNAYKPIGTKLSVINGKLTLQDSGILQGAVRKLYGDSKMNVKLLYDPILYACKLLFNEDISQSMQYIFIQARRGLENLAHTYRDDREIKTCITTYINVIQSTIDSRNESVDFLDILLRLQRTTDMLSLPSQSAEAKESKEPSILKGVDDIKENIIYELNKTWDENKLSIVFGLVKELETASPYGMEHIFNALESFLMCIHEKTKNKTDTVF